MEVRIIKTPPAPWMDGFDVRGFHAGRLYIVEDRLACYLIHAGYAEPAVSSAPNSKTTNEPPES